MLTVKDVAERLKVSTKTVWRLIQSGKLVTCRVGKSVRVDEKDLEAFISKNKSG